MKITILTLFPEVFLPLFQTSILKRAAEKNLVDIVLVNIRDFANDRYKTVDDRPYGGGVGMIMRVDVLYRAISNVKFQMSNFKLKTLEIVPPQRDPAIGGRNWKFTTCIRGIG